MVDPTETNKQTEVQVIYKMLKVHNPKEAKSPDDKIFINLEIFKNIFFH
jgi:hypothetical protein